MTRIKSISALPSFVAQGASTAVLCRLVTSADLYLPLMPVAPTLTLLDSAGVAQLVGAPMSAQKGGAVLGGGGGVESMWTCSYAVPADAALGQWTAIFFSADVRPAMAPKPVAIFTVVAPAA
ncbi:MAG TPA: hypothetical protein VNF49_08150 [Candidatus Binataceae bacterium]|nr:hypothetical protein [Candidatus Binataceae bacterium]